MGNQATTTTIIIITTTTIIIIITTTNTTTRRTRTKTINKNKKLCCKKQFSPNAGVDTQSRNGSCKKAKCLKRMAGDVWWFRLWLHPTYIFLSDLGDLWDYVWIIFLVDVWSNTFCFYLLRKIVQFDLRIFLEMFFTPQPFSGFQNGFGVVLQLMAIFQRLLNDKMNYWFGEWFTFWPVRSPPGFWHV